MTLKFLGDVATGQIETIATAIEKAARGFAPLSLSARGVGVFPDIRRARVFWVGIGGQFRQLGQLQAAVADGLARVGFPAEKRPYKGHLTIGRVKQAVDSRQLAAALTEFSGFETKRFTVDEVVLFRSQLRPDGPIYSRLKTVTLEAH